jgi:hypothetical protein
MKVFAPEYLCVLGELFQTARFVGMCDEFALGVAHINLRFRVYFLGLFLVKLFRASIVLGIVSSRFKF